jgi:hypothetical protein
MHIRLTFLIAIVLAALSAIPIDAEGEIIQGQAQQPKFSNVHSDNLSHNSVRFRQTANERTTAPTNSQSESQVSRLQNEFTNVSLIELSESFSNLIEEVYHQTKDCSYRKSAFPKANTLFNVLFRVIISTNAP